MLSREAAAALCVLRKWHLDAWGLFQVSLYAKEH